MFCNALELIFSANSLSASASSTLVYAAALIIIEFLTLPIFSERLFKFEISHSFLEYASKFL